MTILGGAESTIVKQAADDLRRLSVMFSGILKIAPVLDQVVSLQQAAEESEGRVTVARAQETQLRGANEKASLDLAGLNERINAATSRAANAEKEAAGAVEDMVRSMMNKAAAQADGIKADADRNGAILIANAQQQASELTALASAEADAKKAELAETSAALQKIRGDLADAQKHWDKFRAKVAT